MDQMWTCWKIKICYGGWEFSRQSSGRNSTTGCLSAWRTTTNIWKGWRILTIKSHNQIWKKITPLVSGAASTRSSRWSTSRTSHPPEMTPSSSSSLKATVWGSMSSKIGQCRLAMAKTIIFKVCRHRSTTITPWSATRTTNTSCRISVASMELLLKLFTRNLWPEIPSLKLDPTSLSFLSWIAKGR